MSRLYKRNKIWWWRCVRAGKEIRESTRTTNEDVATAFMYRRVEEIDGHKSPAELSLPKVLILDIETAPMETYVWSFWVNYIDPISQIVKNKDGSPKDWSILTWAAKWLFDSEVFSGQVSLAEAKKRKDKSIIKPLWDLFEEADVIVAHNGDKFDIRRCAWRFKVNGFGPPSPFQTIDTLKVAKKAFGSPSNKQDYLNRALGLPRKIHTEFELWERCVQGDQTGLDDMLEYNIGDITGLEDLYMEIRAWVRGPVNLSMYGENEQKQCHNCLSVELRMLNKPYTTPAGQYQAYRCLRCGAIGRERYLAKTLKQRQNSILATAR